MADGNCLYNACSIALTGKDSCVLLFCDAYQVLSCMKMLSTMQVIQQLSWRIKKRAFTSVNNAFAMCLILPFPFLKHKVLLQRLLKKRSLMHRIWNFSSMMRIFAVVTVTNCRIESYYSVGKDLSPREDCDSLEKMFNCTIFPKHHCDRFPVDPNSRRRSNTVGLLDFHG